MKKSIECKRISASSLFKVVSIGMLFGLFIFYSISAVLYYYDSAFSIISIGDLSGFMVADIVIYTLGTYLAYVVFLYPCMYLGLLCYSRFFNLKLTIIELNTSNG